jgi:hypothetical protein
MTILDGASGGLEEIQGTAKSGDLMATDEIDIDT